VSNFMEAQRRAARVNPLDMIALAHPEYTFAPVHDLYADVIVNTLFAATHPRVVMPRKSAVVVPPRHSKSETMTTGGTAWGISKFPNLAFAIASYEFGLAETFSRQAREMVRYTGREVFGVALSEQTSAADHWSLVSAANPDRAYSGNVKSYGIGSALLGRGYNVAFLDDMTKPGDSPKIRQDTHEWFKGALLSRREPGAATVLIGQRTYTDDLIGRVIAEDGLWSEENPEGWAVYVLPLFAESITMAHVPGLVGTRADLLSRRDGEELWPGRLTDQDLAERRVANVSNAALYQQRPVLNVAAVFDRELFRFYRQAGPNIVYRFGEADKPEHLDIRTLPEYFAIDFATSTSKRADWTCIVRGRFDVKAHRIFVEEFILEKLDSPRLLVLIDGLVGQHEPRKIYIEASATQLGFVQLVQERLRGTKVIVEGWRRPVKESKDDTAALAAARIADGTVFFAETNARSYKQALEQIASFPLSPDGHDDAVDGLGILVSSLAGGSGAETRIRLLAEGVGGWSIDPDQGPGAVSDRGGWVRVSGGGSSSRWGP
jgi:hypothetical protein